MVELQPLRGPCLLNEYCLGTENTAPLSTVLVSNPGEQQVSVEPMVDCYSWLQWWLGVTSLGLRMQELCTPWTDLHSSRACQAGEYACVIIAEELIVSFRGLKQIKSAWSRSEQVTDKEIVDQYMLHVSWKRYKEDVVDDVIARTMINTLI